MFIVRDVVPEDQVHILDCDIKCFDFHWSIDCWAFAGDNYIVKIATYYGTPVGFVTFVQDEKRIVHVPKLGVKPNFRRKGVSRLLMNEVETFAKQVRAKGLEAMLPESVLRPGEPAYVGEWMKKFGWTAVEVVKDVFPSMGQREDGIKFRKAV